MSNFILNVLSTEAAVNTSVANTVSNAPFVRVFNNTAGAVLVTKQVANTANVSLTVAAGQEVFLVKAPADTLTSNAASGVVACSVKVRSA